MSRRAPGWIFPVLLCRETVRKNFREKRCCCRARIVDAKNPEVALLILERATSRWNCWLSQARRSRRYSTNTLTLAARPAASITVSVE
jgi:hypothetical protein